MHSDSVMTFETGTIIEKSGSLYKVRLNRTEACEGCHACLFSNDKTYMIAEAVSEIEVLEGDKVKIQRISISKTKAGFLILILPLFGFLLGFNLSNIIIGLLSYENITQNLREIINLLAGAVFFSIPLIILKLLNKTKSFQMKIVQKN